MAKHQDIDGSVLVAHLRSWLGVKYVYGGTTRGGVDCSGLMLNVAEESGITGCPRTSEEQFAWGIPVDSPSPGDMVFFTGAELDPPPGHVGMVVAPGRMIDAPYTGTVVQEQPFSENGTGVSKFLGYRRMPGVAGGGTANPYTKSGGITRSGTKEAAGTITDVVTVILVGVLCLIAVVALVGAAMLFH